MKNDRIKQLCLSLNEDEGFLITSDISRQYITGFKSSAGVVLITNKGSFSFFDFRYFEKASSTVTNTEVILAKKTFSQIKEKLLELGIKKLFCETSTVSIEEHKAFCEKLSPIEISLDSKMDKSLLALRKIKTKNEIELIKSAQSITDKAFSHILNFIKEGKTEREIALELEFFMRREGSDGVAFDTIAVSGKNSSLPHGVPTDKQIKKGDFITLDFGACVQGYCSDMTRTVAVGHITDEQQEVYQTVLDAQLKGLDTIKAGLLGSAVDAAARKIIADKGYGKYFGHALGHSLGLEIHEAPSCSPSCNEVLQSGMLMTVEPGIYIPERFGVRIEDMVLITENGAENFTHSPKQLILL
ncbi:MAG: aminopeptidase P family protein [Ruminococcaceae bacterium]|nr:aminopeptidase P family protein [Oscillospiraceae bacterium]